MRYDVAGKVVLVTGPARGIGEALARSLAGRGARLSLVGMEPERLQSLAAALGPAHACFRCDVTDQAGLEAAVAGTVAALGGIDIVVANAGIASFGTVATTPVAAQARVIEVNLLGVLRTVVATLPHVVARRGYYLLISSAAALVAAPALAAYSAAKSGVEHLGNVLRLELADRGVDVGVAHPGWIDTDLVRDARAELTAYDRLITRFPPPFSIVTSVDRCVAALVDAIARRRRKVFVPRSLALVSALRPLVTSAIAERYLRHLVGSEVAELERQAGALGRVFGAHSVAMGAPGSERDPPRH
jgi:hypothetical protein